MAKIHLIEDKTIGGVKREYIEAERTAEVGDFVKITDATYNYDMYKNGDVFEAERIGLFGIETDLARAEGNERGLIYEEEYTVLDPTDIVHIDGQRYQLAERKAEMGEKAMVIKAEDLYGVGYSNGDVFTVRELWNSVGGNSGVFDEKYITYIDREYRVLIPVDSEPAEPTPDIHDLLANLAQRVTSLERITGELVRAKSSLESQLLDAQRNIERLAQDHENVAFKVVDIEQSIGSILDSVESNTKDIAFLDERTYEKPGKPTKSAEEILREISKILERDERQ